MGIGISANRNSSVKTITIKNRDGSNAGTITIHRTGKKKVKKLQYKFKRISTQILQSKTSGSAREVLTRAKGETVSLLRKRYTGDYDSNELRRAIQHAKQMERTAKKRMKHLQQEEKLEKKGEGSWQIGFEEEDREDSFEGMEGFDFAELDMEEVRKLMQELQELQEEMAQLEQENDLEELTEIVQTEMDPAELEQLKKKHRSEEAREIMEADMKYLKALFYQLQKERQESSSASGNVSLELSGVEVPVQIDERSAAEVVAASGAVPMAAEGGTIDISV